MESSAELFELCRIQPKILRYVPDGRHQLLAVAVREIEHQAFVVASDFEGHICGGGAENVKDAF